MLLVFTYPGLGDPAPPIVNASGTALRVDKQFTPQTDFSVFGGSIVVTLTFEAMIAPSLMPGGLALWSSTVNNDNSGTGELLALIDVPTTGTGGVFQSFTVTNTVANPSGTKYVPLTSFGGEMGEEEGFESIPLSYRNVTITISDLPPAPPVSGDTGTFDYLIIPNSDAVRAGGVNRQTRVTGVVDGFNFTIATTDYDYKRSFIESGSGVTVTPVAAAPAPTGIPGPFTFDTKNGLALTSVEKVLLGQLNKGQRYQSFAMDTGIDSQPALSFPDEIGYVVFDFGFQDQVGPVKYLGRLSASELLLDASFKFPNTILTGTKVTLLSSKSPFVPPVNEHPGNFYVTGSAAGRIAAQKTIEQIVAAGLQVEVDVVYPGDRGLGGEGLPDRKAYKLTDAVEVWGGDDLDTEIPIVKAGDE